MRIPSAIRRAALALSLCMGAPAAAAPLYFATPLGSLGGADTLGSAINPSGQVTGASNRRAFLYSSGVMTSLGTLGGEWSGGYGINARGDVTGASAIAHSDEQHAFYYTGGVMLDISPPGTRFGVGSGINAGSVIVGTHDGRAFRYAAGVLTVLATLGGPNSSGLAINDAGQIVGGSETQPFTPPGSNPDVHAFVFDDGALTDLGTLGGEYSIAMAINAARQVVGISSTFVDNRAFLYAGTRMFDLLGEATGVNGINASGDIVGQTGNVTPLLYSGGNIRDLNQLLANPLAGAPLTDARAINDAGQIVANSCVLSVCNAFRLDPVVDGVVPPILYVYEFYNAALDHYFVTADPREVFELDLGFSLRGWSRTGRMFKANDRAVAGAQPVWRFYIPAQLGDSHFFSASPDECAAVLRNAATDPNYSGYEQESAAAFHAPLPDASGACPTGTSPVYRLWNRRADSNHRYTTDRAVRAQMIAAGYVPEGYGPDGVAIVRAELMRAVRYGAG